MYYPYEEIFQEYASEAYKSYMLYEDITSLVPVKFTNDDKIYPIGSKFKHGEQDLSSGSLVLWDEEDRRLTYPEVVKEDKKPKIVGFKPKWANDPEMVDLMDDFPGCLGSIEGLQVETINLDFYAPKEKVDKFIEQHTKLHGKDSSVSGGRFTYSITPTGLGNVFRIKCNDCRKFKDVTDYNQW